MASPSIVHTGTIFDTHAFGNLLLSGDFVQPGLLTLWISVASMLAGVLLGILGALGRTCNIRAINWVVSAYLWLFRGTPVIVQIIFWFDALPELTAGTLTPSALVAGFIALSAHEGAYMTEIIRGGLSSVAEGQFEAAKSIGMRYWLLMRRVIIPQAVRIAVPATGNRFITNLKNSSLLYIIAVPELFMTATDYYSTTLRYFESLAVVSLWYLFYTSLFTVLQGRLEKRMARGYQSTPKQRQKLASENEAGLGAVIS